MRTCWSKNNEMTHMSNWPGKSEDELIHKPFCWHFWRSCIDTTHCRLHLSVNDTFRMATFGTFAHQGRHNSESSVALNDSNHKCIFWRTWCLSQNSIKMESCQIVFQECTVIQASICFQCLGPESVFESRLLNYLKKKKALQTHWISFYATTNFCMYNLNTLLKYLWCYIYITLGSNEFQVINRYHCIKHMWNSLHYITLSFLLLRFKIVVTNVHWGWE